MSFRTIVSFKTLHLDSTACAFCRMKLNEIKHEPVMNPKQMCQEGVRNTFLLKYKHKEPQERRKTIFLS